MKRFAMLGMVILLVLTFFWLGLDRYLTLAMLKQSQSHLLDLKRQSPWVFAMVGGLLYVLAAALSLPGALLMTLAMGALFGLVWGTLLVSMASTLGATLAFLGSRYLFRDVVQRRFGAKLKMVNEGVAREGSWYLFMLRMVPIFPFFMVNLLMGLTPLPTRTFYWVSQLGMLVNTVVFVNAGTQLSRVTSLSGIVSAPLLFSLVLLGLLPLGSKKMVTNWHRRRVYAPWQRPTRFDRNLIVIGAGAAGLVSSYLGAALKAKVTLIEAHKMGGDCLNYGCIPSKALIKSAKLVNQLRHAAWYGLRPQTPEVSFRHVMARVHDVIHAVAPHDSVERYTRLGVEVLNGHARLMDPWTVEIQQPDGTVQTLTTRSIIIATGARPMVPPLPGLDEVGYLTSDTLWSTFAEMDEPPAELVVLGGGPIGCELAQSFARLGSRVTQIEMAERLMIREDVEVSERVQAALSADGVNVLTGHQAVRCEKDGEHKFIVVAHNGHTRRLSFDALICAVGRSARLTGFGLETLGIAAQRTIETNAYLETRYPNIYAAGDVAGPYQFTHMAAHQAWYASVNALFRPFKRFKVDNSVVPWTTFVDPEVARVGLNEQEAHEQGVAHEVTRYALDDLDRAIADGVAQGFVKVLTRPGKDTILGVTIVGEQAGELLAEFVLAMKHGLGLNKILGTIHTYPTLAEANKYVAGEWKRAHTPPTIMAWLERYHTWRRH